MTKIIESDPMHYAIYEKVAIPPKAVIPRLWAYRPRITMEKFFQEIQMKYDSDNNPLYPILHYLSENVSIVIHHLLCTLLVIGFAGNNASSHSISS